MSGYRLLAEAALDLGEIEAFTDRTWGAAQAQIYLADLFAAFDRLAADPAIGRRRHDLPQSVLTLPVAKHIVVYRLRNGESVEVLAVLHAAMDVPARIAATIRRAGRRGDIGD